MKKLFLFFVLLCVQHAGANPFLPILGGSVASGGGGGVESLWSTPILQQQTTNGDFANIGTTFSTDADQKIHNTDSSARLVTKVTTYFQETEGSDQTVTLEIRSAAHGGGSLYDTKTLTLHASMTENLAFVVSANIPASTDFYLRYTVNARARILGWDVSGGGSYQGTGYSIYFNGSADDTFDAAFAIYITN